MLRRALAASLLTLVGCSVAVAPVTSPEEPEKKVTPSKDPAEVDGSVPPAPKVVGPSSKGCGAVKPGGLAVDVAIQVGDHERHYDLDVPSTYDPAHAYALVFAYHGGGGTASSARHSFDAKVADGKAIFVYPNAGDGDWDLDTPAAENEDVALFDAVLSTVSASWCIDASRVFATGFSNGGYFSNQLGCSRGDVLRAISPHGGGGPFGRDDAYGPDGKLICAGKPPAVMVVHGEDDGVVTLDEGESSIAHWKSANGCGDDSASASPSPCVSFGGCTNAVVWCAIPELGHQVWSAGVEATWEFFAGF